MTIFLVLSTISSSSSCHMHETIAFLFHVSKKTIKINYNYFSIIWTVTFQFYPVWKQIYFFLLIKSSWLAEIAGVLLAYQDLILLWIPFFPSWHSGIYLSASSRERGERRHWFYTACCYNCNCQLSTKLFLANDGSICKYRTCNNHLRNYNSIKSLMKRQTHYTSDAPLKCNWPCSLLEGCTSPAVHTKLLFPACYWSSLLYFLSVLYCSAGINRGTGLRSSGEMCARNANKLLACYLMQRQLYSSI